MNSPGFPVVRPRRLRTSPALRALVAETSLNISQLVLPLFARSGKKLRRPVEAMPGVFQLSPDEIVREAATALLPMGEALLLERMVTDAVAEIIVGIGRDPAVGPYLLLGSGGVLAELLADTAVLTLPARAADIEAAILTLKAAKLLAGFRGQPAGDIAGLIACILAVQSYALANLHTLLELDVNPVMVRPAGLGAVAVDALIRIVEPHS